MKIKSVFLLAALTLIMLAVGIGIPYLLLHLQSIQYINTEKTLSLETYQLNNESNSSEEHLHKSIRLYDEDNLKRVTELTSDNYDKYTAGNIAIELIRYLLNACYHDIDGTATAEYLYEGLYDVEYNSVDNVENLSVYAYINTKDASLGYWAFEYIMDLGFDEEVNGEIQIEIIVDGLTGNCIYFGAKLPLGDTSIEESTIIELITIISPRFNAASVIKPDFKEETNTYTYNIENYNVILQLEEQGIKYEIEAT